MTILVCSVVFLCLVIGITAIDTQSNGFFTQERIGQHGKSFLIYKLRTLHSKTNKTSFWGRMLRKTKLDEFPQLLNILKGEMTLVGPRPDVAGYADKLEGADRIILNLKPGVTGLASLKYRNEEQILSQQTHPQHYNDEVIWPDKVRINKWYAQNRTLIMDLQIIFYTFFPVSFDVEAFMGKR
ncbi:sugar transferase [Flavobacterium sp.]|uniref:sugar transferase n=1 Tax=Flavobacterium sp. TaxID=239 RepID=UPI001B57E23D|nr:sugar transferase [Flavobacterium sp.]MBP6128211.1 sugar transferase [Flavobacterium sp.]